MALQKVGTGMIANDAVTLAKMVGGVDGQVITYSAAGDPVAIGPGTAGQVLTSAGANLPQTFAAAGGGSWVKIGTSATTSAVATLTVTGLDSTYDTYAIAISDCRPVADDRHPWIRVGDSSGVDSGGSDYTYHTGRSASTGSGYVGDTGGGSSSRIPIGESAGTATGEGCGGMMFLHCPSDGITFPMISGHGVTNNAKTYTCPFAGSRQAVITLDRIQFLFSGGDIARGRLTVWGISHA